MNKQHFEFILSFFSGWRGGVPRRGLGHGLKAIAADQTNRLAGTGDCLTAGALITKVVLPGGGGRNVPRAAVGCAVAAHDAYAVGVVAGQLDFLNVIVQYPLEKFIRKDSGGIRPSVFLRPSTDKAVGFGGLLEILVVISTAPAAILDICNEICHTQFRQAVMSILPMRTAAQWPLTLKQERLRKPDRPFYPQGRG